VIGWWMKFVDRAGQLNVSSGRHGAVDSSARQVAHCAKSSATRVPAVRSFVGGDRDAVARHDEDAPSNKASIRAIWCAASALRRDRELLPVI